MSEYDFYVTLKDKSKARLSVTGTSIQTYVSGRKVDDYNLRYVLMASTPACFEHDATPPLIFCAVPVVLCVVCVCGCCMQGVQILGG